MSLRTRLVLTFGVGSVFFIFLITVLVFNAMVAEMKNQLYKQFKTDGEHRLEHFNYELDKLSSKLLSTTHLPTFKSMNHHELTSDDIGFKNDVKQLELYFYTIFKNNSEIDKIIYIDNSGIETFKIEKEGADSNSRDILIRNFLDRLLNIEKSKIITTVKKDKDNNISNVVWWIPVYLSSGTSYGVLGFSIEFKYFKELLDTLVVASSKTVCLYDDKGLLLAGSNRGVSCVEKSSTNWSSTKLTRVPSQNWKLELFVEPESFTAKADRLKYIIFYMIFPFVAILALIFAYSFSNNILIVIEKLVSAAKSMGRGEMVDKILVKRDDELGDLASEIEKSADLIKAHRDKLEEKNRDLEAYSYTLAHDLRSPLRSITSFSQILEMEAKDRLNKDEQDFIDRIVQASKRMSILIDDILELSRISNREVTIKEVSLSDLSEVILNQFKDTSDERNVETIIAKGVSVRGDAQLLQLIMENLLGNAWKYSSKNKYAVIEFGTESIDGSIAYFVRDNGVGFDMQYADKLFSPFQRLHKSSEFEGTGIGLASVKRMIERHDGRVWISSKLNSGTTIYFTLWDKKEGDV